MSVCTRGRARVVSAHLHFSFLFGPRLLFNTLSTIISLCVCTSECRNFAIRFSESAVFFQHCSLLLYKYTHTHSNSLSCLRVSVCRADAFFGTHSFLFVLGGFCAWFSVFAQLLLIVWVLCTYACLYAHSFRFYWVNLDFERIPFGFNTVVLFYSFFSFFGRAQPKRKCAKRKKRRAATKFIAKCNRPSGLKYEDTTLHHTDILYTFICTQNE